MTGGPDQPARPDRRSFDLSRGKRPRWMTFFTILMFLLGARLFLGSIDDLYRLATGKPEVLSLDGSRDPQQDALLRAQVVLDNQLFRHRPSIMALHTAVRLVVGLVYLFAVAAVMSRDARGRRACLAAGWMGLVAAAGNVMFIVLWVRRALPWILPALAQALAEDAVRLGRPVPAAALVAEEARLFLVDGPVALCVMGMVLSVALLAYFAGRRMRWFYEQSGQAYGS